MDCVRVSFLRDGKERVWFTNYDLNVIRKLVALVGLTTPDKDVCEFVMSLTDLLYFSDNENKR